MTRLRDGLVKHIEMRAQFGQRRFDRRAVRLAIWCSGKKIAHEIKKNCRKYCRILGRYSLFDFSAEFWIVRDELWPWKGAIDKGRDRLRLEQVEINVAHHRNFAERVDAIDLWRMRPGRRQAIGDTFFLASHPRGAHEDGLRCPNDLEFWHAYCLREKCSRTSVCCLIINAPGRRGFSLTLSVRFPRSKPFATRAFRCAVASERLASQWPFTRVPVR